MILREGINIRAAADSYKAVLYPADQTTKLAKKFSICKSFLLFSVSKSRVCL